MSHSVSRACQVDQCCRALVGVAVQVGGYPQEKDTFARICGYVEQSDIHSPRVSHPSADWT
jgi:hypothetical protein